MKKILLGAAIVLAFFLTACHSGATQSPATSAASSSTASSAPSKVVATKSTPKPSKTKTVDGLSICGDLVGKPATMLLDGCYDPGTKGIDASISLTCNDGSTLVWTTELWGQTPGVLKAGDTSTDPAYMAADSACQ